jgi:hypothetical protein
LVKDTMSFEKLRGLNGWTVRGIDDPVLLESDPSVFSAEKGTWKLSIYKKTLVEGIRLSPPPVAGDKDTTEFMDISDWRLRWGKYDVARGRSLKQIMDKAVKFMSTK